MQFGLRESRSFLCTTSVLPATLFCLHHTCYCVKQATPFHPNETFLLLQERSCVHTGWNSEVANGWHTFKRPIALKDQSQQMVISLLLALRRLPRGGAFSSLWSSCIQPWWISDTAHKSIPSAKTQMGMTRRVDVPPPTVYRCRFKYCQLVSGHGADISGGLSQRLPGQVGFLLTCKILAEIYWERAEALQKSCDELQCDSIGRADQNHTGLLWSDARATSEGSKGGRARLLHINPTHACYTPPSVFHFWEKTSCCNTVSVCVPQMMCMQKCTSQFYVCLEEMKRGFELEETHGGPNPLKICQRAKADGP